MKEGEAMTNTHTSDMLQGYRIAAVASSEKSVSLRRILAYLAIFFVIFPALTLPVLIPTLATDSVDYLIISIIFIAIPLAVLYTLVYILIRCIVLKIVTRAPIRCGFHSFYAYAFAQSRLLSPNTVLITKAIPNLLFSIASILLVIFSFGASLEYTICVIFLSVHVIFSIVDSYATPTLLKFRHTDALVADVGDRLAIFVADPSTAPSYDSAPELAEWIDALASEENDNDAKGYSILGIILLCVGAVLYSLILCDSIFGVLYPVYENLSGNPSLYACLVHIVLIIYFIATYGKHMFVKAMVSIFLLLTMPITFIMVALTTPKISHTTDIANYGRYDECLTDGIGIMPKEINEHMSPIRYSYYCDMTWDTTYEVYLEVKMTDSAYEALKSRYSDELVSSSLGEELLEYVITDELGTHKEHPEYVDYPRIEKIVFIDKEYTVIFVTMYGNDPFYVENSAYFDRFDIDPLSYTPAKAKQ